MQRHEVTDDALFSPFSCVVLHIPTASSATLPQRGTRVDAYEGLDARPGEAERLRTSTNLLQGSAPLPPLGRHTENRLGAIGDCQTCPDCGTCRAVNGQGDAADPLPCANDTCASQVEVQPPFVPDRRTESTDNDSEPFPLFVDDWQEAAEELVKSTDSETDFSPWVVDGWQQAAEESNCTTVEVFSGS